MLKLLREQNSPPLVFLELQSNGRWKAWLEGDHENTVYTDSLEEVDLYFRNKDNTAFEREYSCSSRLQDTHFIQLAGK